MILMDSNIIIYVTSGQYPGLTSWFLDNAPSASVMSKVDVLGYHNLKSTEKAELERFFSRLNVIYPTAEEFERAIELRQRHGITDWHSPRTTKKISSGSSHSKSLTQCRDKRNRHPNSWRIRVSCNCGALWHISIASRYRGTCGKRGWFHKGTMSPRERWLRRKQSKPESESGVEL
jgi:hypothetical protein